jgi:cell division initiation protein
MPRRKQEKTKGPEVQPATGESSRITPVEIQQKEFGLAFRGYNERDVDQFLDEVTEEVARLYAENKRLREELEFARTSRLDLGGAEEADALLRQAREEAARLLADARARVSAMDPGPDAPGGRGTAAALAPFVAQEREFLQSLANLIQSHAESVKDQIRRARDAAAQASAREASAQTAAREAAEREAAARAALREEAAARAAFQEAAAPRKPESHQLEDYADDLEDEGSGPATQPWVPEELHSSSPQDWREYYSSPESGDEEAAVAPDEILDLTHEARHPDPDRDRPETGSGDEPDEAESESVRRRLEPQRAAREADPPEDDSIEDRSIRELFWGEDY